MPRSPFGELWIVQEARCYLAAPGKVLSKAAKLPFLAAKGNASMNVYEYNK